MFIMKDRSASKLKAGRFWEQKSFLNRYEVEFRFFVSDDSLTGPLIHLGRGRRESAHVLEQDVENKRLKKRGANIGETWILVVSLIPNQLWKEAGDRRGAIPPQRSDTQTQAVSYLGRFFVLFFCFVCLTVSSFSPFLFWRLCSNFWQSLVSDTWQEALLFETALPG